MPDRHEERGTPSIRQRAVALLHGEASEVRGLAPEEFEHLVAEFQAHQAELENQNAELRSAQRELEQARRTLLGWYDFAPVAYFTVNRNGIIEAANLTAAELLGVNRNRLVQTPFVSRVAPSDAESVQAHWQRLFATQLPQRAEVRLVSACGDMFWAQLESRVVESPDGEPSSCRMVVLDISEIKAAEQERLLAAIVEHSANPIIGLSLDETITNWNPAASRMFGYTPQQAVGSPLSILFPNREGPLVDISQIDKGGVEIETTATAAGGRSFDTAMTASPVRDSRSRLIGIALTIRDSTQRKHAAATEYGARLLSEALRSVSDALNTTLQLDEVLDLILEHVGQVVQHDIAEVMLFEDGIARVVRSRGYAERGPRDEVAKLEITISETLNLTRMLEGDTPLVITDLSKEPGWIPVFTDQPLRSYVGAPIHVRNTIIGCINLISTTPAFFQEFHGDRLQAFADQAGIAINNAHLFIQAQEAAVLRERNRLARDLHDAVSQTLFSASVIAELLPHMLKNNPPALLPNLHTLHLLTRSAMAEMRTLLLELRPESLERYGLADLLEQLIYALRGRRQIEPHTSFDDPQDLPPEIRIVFYRVAQEALNNVVKHSRAAEVSVVLADSASHTALTVEDNGVGFDITHEAAGIGLLSMRERALAVGAALEITSTPGQGTRIRLMWSKNSTDLKPR